MTFDAAGLTAVSLFSGAGGMDVGVEEAGFKIILANDLDADACATYRANHGDVIVEGSVDELMPLANHLHNIDLLFGGPPCQGFSVAGKMNPDDPRSRLMHSFFDMVAAVKPRAFICENVKALAVLSRWSEVRRRLMERANETHHAALIVLNASDYGVPQSRERMFIIGIRKDCYLGSRPEFTDAITAALNTLRKVPESVADIVRRLGRAGSATNRRVCNAKIAFARSPILRQSAYAGMLFNGAGRPLKCSGAASTLPASMGGNKTPIVDEGEIFDSQPSFVEEYHGHLMKGGKPRCGDAPSRLRRLTIDECLAVQTFPADYDLQGSRSSTFRQIGNAVPCKLAEAVATATKIVLLNQAAAVTAEAARNQAAAAA